MYFGPCTFFVVFSSSKLYKSWTLTYDRAVINKEKFADGVIVQSGLLPVLNYWHFSHSMRCGIYETAEHPSVCRSVSVTHRSTATVACSGFAAEHHAAEEVNRQRRVSNSSGTAALRSAANASSVTLTANMLLAQTCYNDCPFLYEPHISRSSFDFQHFTRHIVSHVYIWLALLVS